MEVFKRYATELDSAIGGINLRGSAKGLYEPISYTLEFGGKRLRPMLTLLCAELFCSDDFISKSMPAALAVEIFHNFTLLHDDIMDSAPTRRGRPTVHNKWDSNQAILSGDAMMILSYEVLQRAEPLGKLLSVFNRAAREVCEGQQLDIEFAAKELVTKEQYLEMIHLKTAVLIAAAATMGAISAGATTEQCHTIYEYGRNLGLAFQIQDDLLDTYGTSSTFGKEIGGDIAEGKQTFLRVVALNLANKEQREVLQKSRDYDTVREIYDQLGVREIAQNEILHYFSQAIGQLRELPHNHTEKLEKFSNLLLNRDN